MTIIDTHTATLAATIQANALAAAIQAHAVASAWHACQGDEIMHAREARQARPVNAIRAANAAQIAASAYIRSLALPSEAFDEVIADADALGEEIKSSLAEIGSNPDWAAGLIRDSAEYHRP